VTFLVHGLENLRWLVPLLILLGDLSRTVFTIEVVSYQVASQFDIRDLLIFPIKSMY
jgi:hypothetical protein